ncbi:MAG: heme exporter protein CcmD [Gammaproteobacteria bacterium]|nr:heme exporter protein CcmD [Gammaproteobacteria bacterium]
MSAFLSWLDMGGYASYVWPAYAAVLVVFVSHFFHAKVQKKRILHALKRWSKSL